MKLDNLQCIPLTSSNPAFNPYHSSLTIGVKDANIIEMQGPLIKIEKAEIDGIADGISKCIPINKCKGCKNTCHVVLSGSFETSVTVTDSDGTNYSRGYGKQFSETNEEVNEIVDTMDVSRTLSESDTLTEVDKNTNSNSLEKTLSVAVTNSESKNTNNQITGLKNYSKSYIHGTTEQNTHTETDTTGKTDTKTWNQYNELSNSEEYNRMSKDDFDKYNDDPNLKKRLVFDKFIDGAELALHAVDTGCNVAQVFLQKEANNISKKGNEIAEVANAHAAKANEIAEKANEHAAQANKIAEDELEQSKIANSIASGELEQSKIANAIAEKEYHQSVRANDIAEYANTLTKESNDIARYSNVLQSEANGIARYANTLADRANQIAIQGNNIAAEGNTIAREGNQIAREANIISERSNKIAEKANDIAIDANSIARESNNIAIAAIKSQEELARLDHEFQMYMDEQDDRDTLVYALAGTRTSGTTNVNGSSNGGSSASSKEYSKTYSNVSGINDQTEQTNGYSDGWAIGYMETSGKEVMNSDSQSE
eukprot:jgi/Orpsp1_1/1190793/evm.model.d7180000081262.1